MNRTRLFCFLVAVILIVPLGALPTARAQDEPPYKNPDVPIPERVEDLLGRMTLDEKIGQMTQVEKNSIYPDDIRDLGIGSILSGGGGTPTENTPAAWAAMVRGFQRYALESRLGIPLIYGVDAVHGHNNVVGATIFPHNIGLGAANDPDLMERIGRATAEEVAATGIQWNFAPVVAVPQDIRWGRTYEGYSEDTAIVSSLASAYIRGLQGDSLADPATIAATAKHYVGDGGAVWGTSTRYYIDQGETQVDEATLRAIHLPPYQAAIDAGAMVVMASFSSWDGLKLHAHAYLLNVVLKEELGFKGFVVSDWAGIYQIVPQDSYLSVVLAINAGIDMAMVPYDYATFIQIMQEAVRQGHISEDRIDDAVRRILTVKFMLGLFENPNYDGVPLESVGSDDHRALAREAVAKSLVLLKNEGAVLPLAKDTPAILVAGYSADNLGILCGGWTITWQGNVGDITPGTTILDAIRAAVSEDTEVLYDISGEFADFSGKAPIGIMVVGEPPYAEGQGDRANPAMIDLDGTILDNLRQRAEKVIVILVSGRPLIVTGQIDNMDALVAAWLPGTEGQGVADVLFGDMPFTGKLPYTWPASVEQLPQTPLPAGETPMFPLGFGLTE